MQNLKLNSNSEILSKLEKLNSVKFSQSLQIEKVLNTNYNNNDILIKPPSSLEITKTSQQRYLVEGKLKCSFPKESNIPETKWDHIAGSLLLTISNQIGKILHCSVGHTNGVNLLSMNIKIRKPSPVDDININLESNLFTKMGLLWAKSTIFFLQRTEICRN